jgi:NADH-quinone oxidoreductase subunit M
MDFPISILSIILFVPLAGAVLVLFIPRGKEDWIKGLSIAISLIPLVLSIWIWLGVTNAGGGKMQYAEAPWIPAFNVFYRLGVDGLSSPLVFLTALLTTLSLFYSAYTINVRVREYFFLFLLLEAGMLGVFLSLDLILFYVFWEIGLVPMFLLIGVWGGKRRLYAAIKFFLYTLAGSVAMLLAILAVFFNTGSFNILEVARLQPFAGNWPLAVLVFWGFFLGFAIKVPSFPFHTWLPDAHTEAPTAGSVILAGVLLKLGAYGLIRIALPFFPDVFRFYTFNVPVIPILAVISMVYGALVCMAQWDLKRLIAYSSVSHMGLVTLGLAAAAASLGRGQDLLTSAPLALNGATMQMFTHGLTTGGLFFIVGIIYERTHTRDLKAFGGFGSKLPYYYGMTLVTAFASLGLPGLCGFWSEFFVFRGTLRIIPAFAVVGALAIVFTAGYILWKIVQYVFLGAFDEARWGKLTDMEWWEKATMWPLVALMVAVGIYPAPLLELFNGATTALLGKL